MIAEEIYSYHHKLESALLSSDLVALKDISQQCDQFLRSRLPLEESSNEDLELLAGNMEKLLEIYQSALQIVERAKDSTGIELRGVSRNKAGASKYLDVARSIKS